MKNRPSSGTEIPVPHTSAIAAEIFLGGKPEKSNPPALFDDDKRPGLPADPATIAAQKDRASLRRASGRAPESKTGISGQANK